MCNNSLLYRYALLIIILSAAISDCAKNNISVKKLYNYAEKLHNKEIISRETLNYLYLSLSSDYTLKDIVNHDDIFFFNRYLSRNHARISNIAF